MSLELLSHLYRFEYSAKCIKISFDLGPFVELRTRLWPTHTPIVYYIGTYYEAVRTNHEGKL